MSRDSQIALSFFRKSFQSAAAATTFTTCLAFSALAGFDEGFEAIQRGEFETALRELRPLAEAGHAQAQYVIGIMYDRGDGVEQNFKEALKWHRKSAEQGYALAQFEVGRAFEKGLGTERNYRAAAEWFEKAAQQDMPHAQWELVGLLSEGGLIQEDPEKEYFWRLILASNPFLGDDPMTRSVRAVNEAYIKDMKDRLSAAKMSEVEAKASDWIKNNR